MVEPLADKENPRLSFSNKTPTATMQKCFQHLPVTKSLKSCGTLCTASVHQVFVECINTLLLGRVEKTRAHLSRSPVSFVSFHYITRLLYASLERQTE